MKKNPVIAAAVLAVAGMLQNAQAVLYGFEQITANGNQLVASQLSADVTQSGSQVLITFANSGPIASSITDIYIEDDAGVFAAISAVQDGTGTDFEIGATPGDLPGGNLASPPFSATLGLTSDSESPTQPNGVNPGEHVALLMDLNGGVTFADVIAALDSGDVRFGLHVQAIGTLGGSESFVSGPGIDQHGVPDAGTTVSMLGIALMAAGALRKFIA